MTTPAPASDAVDEASEDDRLWFKAHPHRQYRIRPYRPGEGPPDYETSEPSQGWRWYVVVRQLRAGVRMRLSFQAEGQPATGEYAASRMFKLVLGGGLS
jgi:hypothetical protein